MATLYYFTESYPYGLGEDWKTNELKVLSKRFERIILLPLSHGGNKVPLKLTASNIILFEPVFPEQEAGLKFSDLKLIFSAKFIKSLWKEKRIITNHTRFLKALSFYKRASSIIKSNIFLKLITETNPGDIWYFFWARGWSDMLPFISIPQGIKKYVRFHNYDLYLERNGGYIPFRKSFFDLIDVLLPISESGRLYLENVFLIDPEKIAVVRLGTISKGRSYFSRDGIFRLVSCSNMVSVKRIDKIIGALKLIKDERIEWLHIGDGALKDELQNLARALGPNIQVSFIGKLAPFEVLEYYIGHPVDLFINTSEFEGVPISIMEAFSAGIPVIATDVGGTSEIVDNTVGVLLEPTADSFTISREVKKFIRLTGQERQDFSNAAFERYQNLCNANVCAEKLITILCKNDSDC